LPPSVTGDGDAGPFVCSAGYTRSRQIVSKVVRSNAVTKKRQRLDTDI